MVRIRRFGVVRTATVAAVMYAVVTLFFTVIAALLALGAQTAPQDIGGFQMPAAGFVGVLIFGAVLSGLYAVFGWIATAIACAVYNLVAGWTGGIEVEIEPSSAAAVAPGSTAPPM